MVEEALEKEEMCLNEPTFELKMSNLRNILIWCFFPQNVMRRALDEEFAEGFVRYHLPWSLLPNLRADTATKLISHVDTVAQRRLLKES